MVPDQSAATIVSVLTLTMHARGMDFGVEGSVWVYCPARTKRLSPKLTLQWMGPCVMLERLSEVAYRVQLVKGARAPPAPYQPQVESQKGSWEGDELSLTTPAADRAGLEQGHPCRQCRFPQRLQDIKVS